ncbi:DUF485 domain-containing protein [Streptomyces sp. VRA16 Mangrove soil]|uniref:DUF485 domain-containing protein n=1 Tax=Streptomyces sp. VRA16 Mangrove soil TaxID=2817434 RepID=UPI001A9D65C7|nr:DUF485 domain-containing protein [Streptomyces sp. VRA16 Mangrove soil]MBO1336561.1 DUF485 domain-containing protein [Streptomyces sp. VRA16 Mangrove soil]
MPHPHPPHHPPAHRLPRHPDLPRPAGPTGELLLLRTAYRWQRRVATLTALGYFTLFLLLSAFAPGLMNRSVTGGLSSGLLIGLLQLPVTCLALVLYEHTARRRVDPLAHRLRRGGGRR